MENKIIGYARVSTDNQETENQLPMLKKAGCVEIFEETVSGSVPAFGRPIFLQLWNGIQAGDTLVVSKLDRLGRSTIDVLKTIEAIKEKGVNLKILDFGLDTTTPIGRLSLSMLASFAEFERQMIGIRTKEALQRRKAQGVVLGRPTKLSADEKQLLIEQFELGASAEDLAEEFGLNRSSVYRILANV